MVHCRKLQNQRGLEYAAALLPPLLLLFLLLLMLMLMLLLLLLLLATNLPPLSRICQLHTQAVWLPDSHTVHVAVLHSPCSYQVHPLYCTSTHCIKQLALPLTLVMPVTSCCAYDSVGSLLVSSSRVPTRQKPRKLADAQRVSLTNCSPLAAAAQMMQGHRARQARVRQGGFPCFNREQGIAAIKSLTAGR